MWIKICGITSPEAVQAALAAGADAIGFVFAPSPRRIDPAAAARLALPVRGRLQCVAVTQHPTPEQIKAILRGFGPDVLQMDWADFERLDIPETVMRLPVVRSRGASTAKLPQRLLFEGPRSGSGIISDWGEAASLARSTELVLAGGLAAGNVAAAIAAVRPFGVDVSSGVEDAPGIKNPTRIGEFVGAARAAFNEIEHESVRNSR